MSRLEKLIQELCPGGIHFRLLDDICVFKYGYTEKALDSGNTRFIRITDITEYGNLSDKSIKFVNMDGATDYLLKEGDLLVARTGATYGKTLLFEGNVRSCYASFLIRIRFKVHDILPRFYWHFSQSQSYWDQANSLVSNSGGQPQFNANVLKKIVIPIPPLPIQQEIVRILDTFTVLEAELEAELEARKKQYEYYRGELLAFGENTPIVPLGAVCKNICSGKSKLRSDCGKYSIYGSTGIIGYSDEFAYKEEAILVARVGANCGYVHLAMGCYDVSDNTLILNPNMDEYNLKFAYYQLTDMNLNQYSKGGGQPLITAGQLKRIQIHLPPLPEQERIVAILDRFDALVNDITQGLPAEIAARRKQYEYYRDKLLTFERKDAAV